MTIEIPEGFVACPHCKEGARHCWNCWGRGFVLPGSPDEFCGHEFADVGSAGRCLTIYECVTCGHRITVDSS